MAEQETATVTDLRKAVESHRKGINALRNNLHSHLTRYGPKLSAVAREELAVCARQSQRALEEAHNIEAGVKLLVPR